MGKPMTITVQECACQYVKPTEALGGMQAHQQSYAPADGFTVDAMTPAARWAALSSLQQDGAICGLRQNAEFGLEGSKGPVMCHGGQAQRIYRADFAYICNRQGVMIAEDGSSEDTEEFRLTCAVLAAQGLHVVSTRKKRLMPVQETISQMRKRHELERLRLYYDHMHLTIKDAAAALGDTYGSIGSFLQYRGFSWKRASIEAVYPEFKTQEVR